MFADIRAACAHVSQKAEHVFIDEDVLETYAQQLSPTNLTPTYDTVHHYSGDSDTMLAYIFTLGTINFGSGYFPFLKKRPGMSGYFTVASYLKDRFDAEGAFSVSELKAFTGANCARLFQQPLDSEEQIELINLFAQALNDLGSWLERDFGGRFAAVIAQAEGSAERLADLLTDMPLFRDVARYKGFSVPLYKRAQITVSDLALAFRGETYGTFEDLDRLTMFADNLVPHVLRLDGVLRYSSSLAEKIDAGEFLEAGSLEETELRAVALHTVERLTECLQREGMRVWARDLDIWLWERGQGSYYRNLPRHRTRTVFY